MNGMASASDVRPGQIAAYLAEHGWEKVEERETTDRWRLLDGHEGRSVIVVRDPRDPDYEDYLAILFARLGEVEQRDSRSLVRDMLNAGRDVLTVSIAAPTVREGEIPVSYGEELFGGVRDLIAASGRAVKATRANFAGPTPPEVMEALDRLSFGETRAGSYVVTVKTPVAQQLEIESTPGPAGMGFEREAVARTIEAVAAAKAAGGQLQDEDVVDQSIEHGVSAQLCKALVRLDPKLTGITIEISAQWASGLPVPISGASSVRLASGDLARVRRLGEALGGMAPEEGFQINGWIRGITYDQLGADRGVVTVEARIKGRLRDVRLELEGQDFREAQMLAGHGALDATGTLEKAGRAWVLTAPRDVKVSQEPAR